MPQYLGLNGALAVGPPVSLELVSPQKRPKALDLAGYVFEVSLLAGFIIACTRD
jgi:hypothetical protein